jgi:hypothetical protein
VSGVRHPAQPLANVAESSVGGVLARLLRNRAGLHEERGPVHSIDEAGVGVGIQTGSKMASVCAQKDAYEPEMQDGVAMQESVGALGRASGERGRRKALVLMMLGQGYPTPMRRMRSNALSEASGRGERRP